MPNEPLITKYRPIRFDEMVGNRQTIEALQRRLKEATHPHSFLFTGQSGVGKTTAARIVAAQLGCELVEIAAASYSGVDDMRSLVDITQHRSLSGAGNRMFLLDEAHTITRAGFQALLKVMEEPPPHVYFALCTTEPLKIPETIQQRCYHVQFRSVPKNDIDELLSDIASLEGWQVADDVMQAVVTAADGSPRKALSMLQRVHDLETKEEARRVINLMDASNPIIELCQFLLSGKSDWKQAAGMLARIEEDEYENAQLIACRYITAAMLKSDTPPRRGQAILDALLFPSQTYDKRTAFITGVGRLLLG